MTSLLRAAFLLVLLVVVTGVFMAGCKPPVALLPHQLTAEHRAIVEAAEEYYVRQASSKAAFTAGCAADGVAARVVSTSQAAVMVDREDWTWAQVARPASIGVEACGSRISYLLICGQQTDYTAPVLAGAYKPACTVAQEGASATAAVREQQRIDAAATAEEERRRRTRSMVR